MATYDQWNNAIIEYFTKGLSYGAKVYLSVDDDALRRIGKKLEVEFEDPLEDFLTAVRNSCCREDDIRFDHFRREDEKEHPGYVAFLVATVLAAYRMGVDDEVTDGNYFHRLREVFGLPSIEGRPPGMRGEENLWLDWEKWLQSKGYLSTARRGAGPMIYISYPISQSLLRATDEQHLHGFFHAKHYPLDLDVLTFSALLLRDRRTFSRQHLKEVLHDNLRFQATAEACYEVYQQLESDYDDQIIVRQQTGRHVPNRLIAGMYRVEDPFSREVGYYIFPRQQKRTENIKANVDIDGKLYPLYPERAGWYAPVGDKIISSDIGNRREFALTDHPDATKLIFPKRDFWVLVPDDDNEESGVYADWNRPQPGTYFYLLCHRDLSSQVQFLKEERLLDWEGGPRPLPGNDEWLEYTNMLVQSPSWVGVMNVNPELYSALCPLIRLGISLKGGIRCDGAWFNTHPPIITINGYHKTAQVTIHDTSTGAVAWEGEVSVNEPLTQLPALESGQYLITAERLADSVQRLFKSIEWKEVDFELSSMKYETAVSNWVINGAVIKKAS